VRDGWWAEGYNGRNGWLIEPQSEGDDVDRADAEALYQLIEQQVVPTFYDRDPNGIPRRWLTIVREAIRSVAPRFSARRMLKQYAEEMYAPAMEQYAIRSEGL
jgi:starch phosphorylase